MELTTKFRTELADRYSVEGTLSEGSSAVIYLANDLRHRRRVALKVLRPDASLALSDVRFVREIKFLANLQHPNILPLYDSGHAAGLLYYVMPHVAGETLRARMDRDGRLGLRDAVRIACQLAAALDYAHRHGVIHRDIKPENILLSDSHALLMDFGIARAVGVAAGDQLTAPLSVGPGTPRYMSPEQLIPGHELDGRSDIYSLGTVVFEMLTGQVPFPPEEGRTVDVRKLSSLAPRMRTIHAKVPQALDDAVARALSPMPADRFGSALELATVLEATIVTPMVLPALSSGDEATPRSSTRHWFMRRGPYVVSAMIVALLVVWWLIRSASAR
jgi:serine/threonine-protein kinase